MACDTHEIVTGIRRISLAHGVKRKVAYTAKPSVVPLVHMPVESYGSVPVGEFLEDIVQLLAGVCRRELLGAGAEYVGVGECERMAHVYAMRAQHTILYGINLNLAESAVGRVEEYILVIHPFGHLDGKFVGRRAEDG